MGKTLVRSVIALAVAALVLQPAIAAVTGFLKIAGVDGESSDKNHENWIEVLAVTWESGVPKSVGTRSTNSGPGSVKLVKRVDKASAALQSKAAGGQKLSEVVLHTPGTGPDGKPGFWVYRMIDVKVSSFQAGGSTSLEESISFSYSKISHSYTPAK